MFSQKHFLEQELYENRTKITTDEIKDMKNFREIRSLLQKLREINDISTNQNGKAAQ